MNDKLENEPSADSTTKYWQWILSIPKDANPLNTGNTNNDEFLYLPCTGGGEDCSRKLQLSGKDARKNILIPIFASESCTGEVPNATDDQLLEGARTMASPLRMQAYLDGKALLPYYVETEPFEVRVPVNHVLENEKALPGIYRAIACGYWHMLRPLRKGKHVISFGGTGVNGFHTKVLYEVRVS